MDLVIFTMRSDKSNKYCFRRIIDFDNQSIFIASNVEYDSVAAQKIAALYSFFISAGHVHRAFLASCHQASKGPFASLCRS